MAMIWVELGAIDVLVRSNKQSKIILSKLGQIVQVTVGEPSTGCWKGGGKAGLVAIEFSSAMEEEDFERVRQLLADLGEHCVYGAVVDCCIVGVYHTVDHTPIAIGPTEEAKKNALSWHVCVKAVNSICESEANNTDVLDAIRLLVEHVAYRNKKGDD